MTAWRAAATGAVVAALAGLVLGRLRATYSVVTVRGDSMRPTYADGDRLLVRWPRDGRFRNDQVVVFRAPVHGTGHEWLVKRVHAVAGANLVVRGDNPRSLDSRHFGPVSARTVKGVVLRRIGG